MDRTPKLIKFPTEMVKEINMFKKENYLSSFSAAVYELIRRGLRH